MFLNLSRDNDKLEGFEDCCGAAVFVDGIFASLEMFFCSEMMKKAFSVERRFVSHNRVFLNNSQMFSVIGRLIKESRIKDVEVVKSGPVKKSVSLCLCGVS